MSIRQVRQILGFMLSSAALLPLGSIAETPNAFFQNATSVVVQDNRINLNRVAVRDSTGAFKYFDIALKFKVAANGTLTLDAAATKITTSPALVTGSFTPGIYTNNTESEGCEYTVGAPGSAGGSRVAGSLVKSDSSSEVFCPYLSIDWVTGPIAGHPDQARLDDAGITTEAYSWGTVGGVGYNFEDLGWEAGEIVGVIQTGTSLVVRNFGDDNTVDQSITFIFCSSCE